MDRRDEKAIIIFEIFLKDRPPCGLTLISPAALDIACLVMPCQLRCNERMYDPSHPLNSDIQFACNNTRQSGDINSKLTLHFPQIVSKLCAVLYLNEPHVCAYLIHFSTPYLDSILKIYPAIVYICPRLWCLWVSF